MKQKQTEQKIERKGKIYNKQTLNIKHFQQKMWDVINDDGVQVNIVKSFICENNK